MSTFKNSKALRWVAPVGAIAIVGAAIGAGPVIAAAKGNPTLAPRTAAQLLAAADQAARTGKAPAFSGTVIENASLGLPQLPSIGTSGASLTSLLTGSNTVRLWYQDQQHARFALLGTGSETDVILNGQNVWEWSSQQNTATHSVLTPDKPGAKPAAKPKTPLTPQQAANQALAQVNKDTTVSVDPTARVAGRAAYQLVLAPKSSSSLIGEVRIALDGQNYVPLRVQVFARGSNSPSAQVGFTQVSFSKPAAANFDFTPPAGAKVVQKTDKPKTGKPDMKGAPAVTGSPDAKGAQKTIGSGWTTVLETPMSAATQTPQRGGSTDNRMIQSLLGSATKVSGSWGSGRVLTTKLVSALLTDDGRLFVGAVNPSVLEQAAAQK
jgi:outer membrane lipoprotein-sorting protein